MRKSKVIVAVEQGPEARSSRSPTSASSPTLEVVPEATKEFKKLLENDNRPCD